MSNLYRVGCLATDDPAVIIAAAASVSALQYMTFESPVGTDYQVPVGKTLYITRIIATPAAGANRFIIGYGSAGVPDQAAAPAGWFQLCEGIGLITSAKFEVIDVFHAIPASMYPCLKSADGGAAFKANIFGVLV